MKTLGLSPGLDGKRVVVQGLGNVGYHAAKFCREGGAIIVGDRRARRRDPSTRRASTRKRCSQHRKDTGSILDFPGATDLADSAAALELDCDILIPAALENVLTAENAPRIKAQDHPRRRQRPDHAGSRADLPPEGRDGDPRHLRNAGGVTVSYFEWLKNLSHVRFGRMAKRHEEANELQMLRGHRDAPPASRSRRPNARAIAKGPDEADLVNSGLEETMISAFQESARDQALAHGVPDLRIAAFLNAIHKVARSYMELGIFP